MREGRVPMVPIRGERVEPGLPSLHPLYSIPAALEFPTYHFCKTRPLDFQDEIKLPTPLVLRGEADNEGKPVLEPRLLRPRDNRDQARRMMKSEWLVPDRLPQSCKGLECEVSWGCLAYAAGQVVVPRPRAEALCRQHPHNLDFNPK